jgi:hypothetical protein
MFASDMKPPIRLEVLTEINGPPFQHRFGDRWGPAIFRPPNVTLSRREVRVGLKQMVRPDNSQGPDSSRFFLLPSVELDGRTLDNADARSCRNNACQPEACRGIECAVFGLRAFLPARRDQHV